MNPYDTSEYSQQNDRRGVSRFRLACESALVGVVSSALTISIYTVMWDRQERLEGSIENYQWAPLHDLDAMLMLMPFGYIIYTLLPPGWIFWAGFIIAQRSRRRAAYALCALSGIVFGIIWPKHLVGMLSI